jgi:hypothetical protein
MLNGAWRFFQKDIGKFQRIHLVKSFSGDVQCEQCRCLEKWQQLLWDD